MRRRRGFTLIEVLICMGIMAVMIVPFYNMVVGVTKAYDRSTRLVNLRSDTDRVGFRVISILRAGAFTIDKDNRGARGQGSVRWEGDTLRLEQSGHSVVLAQNVSHFSLYRRDGLTVLTLELKEPVAQGAERRSFVVEEGGRAKRL